MGNSKGSLEGDSVFPCKYYPYICLYYLSYSIKPITYYSLIREKAF